MLNMFSFLCVTGNSPAAGDDAFAKRADTGPEPSLW